MVRHFNLGELKSIFYEFGIDPENVPQPATKQDYVWYLMHFFEIQQQQTAFIAKLAESRPRVEWPSTYSISVEMYTHDTHHIKIGEYIRNQNVNIVVNQPNSSMRRLYKHNKAEQINWVEQVLFEKIFRHAKKFVIILIFAPLFILTIPVFFLGSDKGTYDMVVLITVLSSPFVFILLFKVIFAAIYGQVRKTTDFYDLSVNHRERVKGKLQNRRWGNKFWNFACKSFIEFFLQTNKNNANRINWLI